MTPLTEIVDRAPWREAVTYRDTWPHEYVLTDKDNQRELLDAIWARFRAGEGFLAALLRTKEAWLEVSYNDGRKEVRRWDAPRMSPSSNVINNLRSRPEFRAGNWQNKGIASLRVSIERPRSEDA